MLYTDLVLARSLGNGHSAAAYYHYIVVIVLCGSFTVRICRRCIRSDLLRRRHYNSAVLRERVAGVKIASRLDDDLGTAPCLTV